MAVKETLLTPNGVAKLEEELNQLKTIKRREVAERIKEAIAFGDLSENSEYDEAKNEQAFVEGRIVTLEKMLKNVRVIDEDDITTESVGIGSKVTILDIEYDETFVYTIVGSAEADPRDNKISNESPVGRALIGHVIDDIVEISVPDGIIEYKILEIKK